MGDAHVASGADCALANPKMLIPLANKLPDIVKPFRGWGRVLVLTSLAALLLVFSLFIRRMLQEYAEGRAHTSAIASQNGRTAS